MDKKTKALKKKNETLVLSEEQIMQGLTRIVLDEETSATDKISASKLLMLHAKKAADEDIKEKAKRIMRELSN